MAGPGKQVSMKQVSIDKTNARMVAVIGVAAFLVVFFLVAAYTLFGQMMYQNKVIGKKKAALNQLQENIKNRDSLVSSYQAFVSAPQNLIGGNPDGTGPRDGSNAKLVLDALPSKYDFPALATSLEKLLTTQNVAIQNITGTDDEVSQDNQQPSASPTYIEMPFEFTVSGDYDAIQGVMRALELSIRPIQVQTVHITAEQQDKLTLTVTAKTYYQPEKALTINETVVK